MPIVVLTLRAITLTFGITWFHSTTTTTFLGLTLLCTGTEGSRCDRKKYSIQKSPLSIIIEETVKLTRRDVQLLLFKVDLERLQSMSWFVVYVLVLDHA